MQIPYRIETKPSFKVIGIKVSTTNQRKEGRKRIPETWAQFRNSKKESELLTYMDQEPYGVLGISVYNTDEKDSRKFDYYIAVSQEEQEQSDFDCYIVPAMTWAIFPCTLETMGKTQVQAITKWLPKSDYRPLNKGYITGRMKAHAPDIEYYGKGNEIEIWVAVISK